MRIFMKSTGTMSTGILLTILAAGSAMAQTPNPIQQVQNKMNGVQQQNKAASDAALKTSAASGNQSKAAASPAAKAAAPAKQDPFSKTAATKSSGKTAAAKPVQVKADSQGTASKSSDTKTAEAKVADSKEDATEQKDTKKEGFITAGSRRDPFISPIVQHMGGSGCSTGKRCLAIDQIALRGIVKSDAGMIAVVVNSLDKAYFLRENDPVFNGYVLKISGDTVVFKETVQDKLGHLSTREVTKKITTPAV
jgi:hypothetical protein